MSSTANNAVRPLDGVRVLELGQLIAGPYTGTLLAYFGAEVIKVEPPGEGDPIRRWRIVRDGSSLWWRSIGRNKKCITLNLKTARGRELVAELAERCDVLIENFRPGTMERWGLGPEALKQNNPDLVYARISGYGQTGPYAERPGYASVCEGFGGFRYVNGFPDQPPTRPNLSIGDTIAALHAALGIVMALFHRGRAQGAGGQTVDVALYEAIFSLLEGVVPEYDGAGIVRQPSGSTVTGIVPTNTYLCRDGKYVIIGGNGDSIYRRLMHAAAREDLAEDPRLAHNEGRVEHEAEIDAALSEWAKTLDSALLLEKLEDARVPAGPIYSVADMATDPQFLAREMFEQVYIDGQPLKLPAIAPKLMSTPGGTDWPGPEVGSSNAAIFGELLGLGDEALDQLRRQDVI